MKIILFLFFSFLALQLFAEKYVLELVEISNYPLELYRKELSNNEIQNIIDYPKSLKISKTTIETEDDTISDIENNNVKLEFVLRPPKNKNEDFVNFLGKITIKTNGATNIVENKTTPQTLQKSNDIVEQYELGQYSEIYTNLLRSEKKVIGTKIYFRIIKK